MRHVLSSGQGITASPRRSYPLLALGDATGNQLLPPFTPSQMSHHRDQPENDEDCCGQAQEEAREARLSPHPNFQTSMRRDPDSGPVTARRSRGVREAPSTESARISTIHARARRRLWLPPPAPVWYRRSGVQSRKRARSCPRVSRVQEGFARTGRQLHGLVRHPGGAGFVCRSPSGTCGKLRQLPAYRSCGLALRNSFIIGMMALPLCISVTCVVFGRTASLDSERGRRSPKTSSPLRRNISAM
jgi:hypothetical protein